MRLDKCTPIALLKRYDQVRWLRSREALEESLLLQQEMLRRMRSARRCEKALERIHDEHHCDPLDLTVPQCRICLFVAKALR